MKSTMDAQEIDRILDGARATWKAASERDEALARKASERRLLESVSGANDAEGEAAPARARWKMRDAIPVVLCAVACVVIGLLLRNGAVPRESIRPEALLAPPPIDERAKRARSPSDERARSPIVAPPDPTETATSQAASGTSPALPKPTSTPEPQRSPVPASTLPQLPPPAKVDAPSDTRLVGPAPKSIKSLYDDPRSVTDASERSLDDRPRKKVPRHPRFDRREWNPPVLAVPPVKPVPPDPPRGRGRGVHRL